MLKASAHLPPAFRVPTMLSFLGSKKTLCDGMTRRDMLKVGALAVGGLTLTDLLRAEQAAGSNKKSAKSVIMVYMCGAPGASGHVRFENERPGGDSG